MTHARTGVTAMKQPARGGNFTGPPKSIHRPYFTISIACPVSMSLMDLVM